MSDRKPSAAKSERRIAPREKVQPISVRGLTSLDHKTQLSRIAYIVDVSTTGFLLHVDRKELIPPKFRDALSLAELDGDQVILMIDPLNLEIGGKVVRSKRLTKEKYEICIDFSEDAPEYWREALVDMLPRASDYE